MIALALIVGLAVWAKLTSKEPKTDAERLQAGRLRALDQTNPAWCDDCQSMRCNAPNRRCR